MGGGMILPKVNMYVKSYKCSINDISKSNLNLNTKPFIYMGDNRPVDSLVMRVGIPKYIGNVTSPITHPIFNVLPQLCVCSRICNITPVCFNNRPCSKYYFG